MREKKDEPTMNEDIAKYPCYMYYLSGGIGTMMKADWITSTESYNHYVYDLHHFVPRKIRRKNPTFYKRVEYLQRLILMPKRMNVELENSGAETILKNWKVYKFNFVFSRDKWREGYYD